eukprot:1218192-Amphidinium_carterae.1
MAPEKVADRITCKVIDDRVDTYAAARRILTECCEANREKDLDLLQKGKDKGKGKGKYDFQKGKGKGKDKGKGKGKDLQAKGSKDTGAQQQPKRQTNGSGQRFDGYCGSCGKWGHKARVADKDI